MTDPTPLPDDAVQPSEPDHPTPSKEPDMPTTNGRPDRPDRDEPRPPQAPFPVTGAAPWAPGGLTAECGLHAGPDADAPRSPRPGARYVGTDPARRPAGKPGGATVNTRRDAEIVALLRKVGIRVTRTQADVGDDFGGPSRHGWINDPDALGVWFLTEHDQRALQELTYRAGDAQLGTTWAKVPGLGANPLRELWDGLTGRAKFGTAIARADFDVLKALLEDELAGRDPEPSMPRRYLDHARNEARSDQIQIKLDAARRARAARRAANKQDGAL